MLNSSLLPPSPLSDPAAFATPAMAQYLASKRGLSRLPPVLPHGRFLRAVLRRRGEGGEGAGYRADQARPAWRPGHPHVRRAGPCHGWLSGKADPQRLQGRGLRADGGSGRGEEARRRQGRRAARGHPRGDAGHHHRGRAAGRAAPQLPGGPGRCGRRDRLGLARHVHRRFPYPADFRRGARCGAGAARSRRDPAGRPAAAGSAAVRAVQRLEIGPLAAAQPALRQRQRPPPPGEALWRAGAGGLRRLLPGGTRRRRCSGGLCGDDPAGQAAAPVAAEAPGPRCGAGDRCRHPAQSRADAQPGRRAPGLAAVGHRPHPQRRRRAAAGGVAGRAIDRSP